MQATSGGVIGSGTTFVVDATGTRYAVGQKGAVRRGPHRAGLPVDEATCGAGLVDELFGDGPALTAQAATQAAGGQQ